MSSRTIAVLTCLASLPLAARARCAEESTVARTVERGGGVAIAPLSLEEVLRLYRENDAAKEPAEEAPPVLATVDKIEFVGRLLGDSVELTAAVQVTVLADEQWVSVPLLRVGSDTALAALPDLENAALTIEAEHLTLVSRTAGRHGFELRLLNRARAEGSSRRATIQLAAATLATLRAEFDPASFRLADHRGSGTLSYARGGRLELRWEVLAGALSGAAARAESPAAESFVAAARTSIVTSLEGRRTIRILFDLRYGGPRTLELSVPEGQSLERLYDNGVSIPVESNEGLIAVEVRPPRAGLAEGTLEAVLTERPGRYSLSGELDYMLPGASWPVHEVFVDLHEPPMFNFAWRGGSLAPTQELVDSPPYSYEIPTPGKRLSFHQVLIQGSNPTLRLDYDIDLTGRYYLPGDRTRAGSR